MSDVVATASSEKKRKYKEDAKIEPQLLLFGSNEFGEVFYYLVAMSNEAVPVILKQLEQSLEHDKDEQHPYQEGRILATLSYFLNRKNDTTPMAAYENNIWYKDQLAVFEKDGVASGWTLKEGLGQGRDPGQVCNIVRMHHVALWE